MSYKTQIEWLRKNHFLFEMCSYEKRRNTADVNNEGTDFIISDEISFILKAGMSYVPVKIEHEMFISSKEAQERRAPSKIIQKINFGGKEFVSEKERVIVDDNVFNNTRIKTEDYEDKSQLPKGMEVMIKRMLEKAEDNHDIFLGFNENSEYKKELQKKQNSTPKFDSEKEKILRGIKAIEDDFESYRAINKDMVREFISEEMSIFSNISSPEKECVKEILRPLRKLVYREEANDSFYEIIEVIKTKVEAAFKEISETSKTELTTQEIGDFHREKNLKILKENIESDIKSMEAEIERSREEIEDQEEFISYLESVLDKKIENGSIGEHIEKQEKIEISSKKKIFQEKIKEMETAKASLNQEIQKLNDVEGILREATTIRMRLVPNTLFEMLMEAHETPLEGKERELQSDLNSALLNTTNPQGFLNLLQKFSGDEQDSIVYFAMNKEAEKVDNMINAHIEMRHNSTSENVA